MEIRFTLQLTWTIWHRESSGDFYRVENKTCLFQLPITMMWALTECPHHMREERICEMSKVDDRRGGEKMEAKHDGFHDMRLIAWGMYKIRSGTSALESRAWTTTTICQVHCKIKEDIRVEYKTESCVIDVVLCLRLGGITSSVLEKEWIGKLCRESLGPCHDSSGVYLLSSEADGHIHSAYTCTYMHVDLSKAVRLASLAFRPEKDDSHI